MAFMADVEWVGEATNGSQVARLVVEQQPDVVLIDVRMPEMDGIEATRQIKSQTPTVRVVVLTLYPDYEAEAMAAGADAFLVKGGSTEDLRGAICCV